VYGPIFRNLQCLEDMQHQDLFADAPEIAKWRDAVLQRPSVINAVGESFNQDFCDFVVKTGSVFARTAA
jgi:hypothetical protein